MRIPIELQKSNNSANIYRKNQLSTNDYSLDIMQIQIENKLNKNRYHLSNEAKKRLKWMYIIKYECGGNVSKSAIKIGVSRTWLSTIYNRWKINDPRTLEPDSRAPKHTDKRKKISKETEDKIVEIRNKYHWGQEKIAVVLKRDHKLGASPTTVNRYLHKYNLIDIKLSNKNRLSWGTRKSNQVEQLQRMRPPKEIKDYKPGALIEKDMKFIVKAGKFVNTDKYKVKENYWCQHTILDSFTRLRVTPIFEDGTALSSLKAYKYAIEQFPFKVSCANTDNGSENGKEFAKYLKEKNIVHFFSRVGTPTDNPRVERSHLTDDKEFYSKGNICKTFEEQIKKNVEHDRIYNYIRPHQALGNLTPIVFHKLWKKDPDEAYGIVDKYQNYLQKNRIRLANSRRMRNKEKIGLLMEQIDARLG